MSTFETVSVNRLAELGSHGTVDLIDVRTPAEFREVHATMARNVPLDSLDTQRLIAERGSANDKPLYVICLSGGRSRKACEKLIAEGLTNVVDVEGGTNAWDAAGLPVKRGKKTIALERQVRICAGGIALLGSVAAMVTQNVYLAGIPAFIGAGLVFAGITDTCGMGMMLAKMPWNRVGPS